jgi:hypothetical protein
MIGSSTVRAGALTLGVWLAVVVAVVDAPRVEEAPGFIEARGAYFIHRPMPLVVTLGRVAPGVEFVALGDAWPEVFGPSLGPVWITEALLGLARAAEVTWLDWPDGMLPIEFGAFEEARLIWDGREPLFGKATLHLAEPSSGTIVFFRDEEQNTTTFVDLALIDDGAVRQAISSAREGAQR